MSRPIVIIEHCQEDKMLLERIFSDLDIAYYIEWFDETASAMRYLKNTTEKVFLILCEVDLPGQNGLAFKKIVDDDALLRKKGIPFVFFSDPARQDEINRAYIEMTVQGFFKKSRDYHEMKAMISLIVAYWSLSRHPNAV